MIIMTIMTILKGDGICFFRSNVHPARESRATPSMASLVKHIPSPFFELRMFIKIIITDRSIVISATYR